VMPVDETPTLWYNYDKLLESILRYDDWTFKVLLWLWS
jgi:hypothetical protein